MGDWVSHVLLAYGFAVLADARWKSLVVGGALLPDVFPRAVETLLNLGGWSLMPWFFPTHTFVGSALLAAAAAQAFARDRREAFGLLSLGALTHYVSDGLERHFAGHAPLWPFSDGRVELGLWWTDEIMKALTVAAAFCGTMVLLERAGLLHRWRTGGDRQGAGRMG